jgi:hypothetical protein
VGRRGTVPVTQFPTPLNTGPAMPVDLLTSQHRKKPGLQCRVAYFLLSFVQFVPGQPKGRASERPEVFFAWVGE